MRQIATLEVERNQERDAWKRQLSAMKENHATETERAQEKLRNAELTIKRTMEEAESTVAWAKLEAAQVTTSEREQLEAEHQEWLRKHETEISQQQSASENAAAQVTEHYFYAIDCGLL